MHLIHSWGSSPHHMRASPRPFLFAASVILLTAEAFCSSAHADEPTSDTTLEGVVVTASTREQTLTQAPASISVITAEQLAKRPNADLTDALRDVEGVSISGGSNTQDIFIRGLPGSYTLILVDGKRQSTRDTRINGNAGFEQSFTPPATAIERIEVVRGPMSSLYGSDAIGGVINIITLKGSDHWGGSVAGDYIAQGNHDSGDWRQGQFYLAGPALPGTLGVQSWGRFYERTEDDILNGTNGSKDYNLTARLDWLAANGHEVLLQGDTTRIRRESSAGANLAANAADNYNINQRRAGSLGWNGRWSSGTSNLSVLREETRRTNFVENASGAFIQDVRAPKITNTVVDGLFQLPLDNSALGDHALALGGQYLQNRLVDINPGLRNTIAQTFSLWQRALFVEDEWRIAPSFALTGGVRLDDHDIYGTRWSPRLYAVWNAASSLTVKGGVSTGFRAPEIRQIAPGYAYTTGGSTCTYGPTGTCGVILGEPNLQPETSTNYEVNALFSASHTVTLSATAFRTDFRNKIDSALVYNADGTIARWSENPNYRLYYFYNLSNARIHGIEFGAGWRPIDRLRIKGGYTLTDSEQESGDYKGYPLARTPKHMANLRADFETFTGLTLWSAANYHGEELNAGLRVGTNGQPVMQGTRQVGRRYPSYVTVDLGGAWRARENLGVKFGVFNVGDKQLDVLTYDFQGDGRRYWLGANFDF